MIGSLIAGSLKSALQIGRHVLFGKKPDVIFYYPQIFNRSKEGTNPYFAPLIRVCENTGLRYIMIEESAEGYPTDSRSLKGDALFWLIWFIRKFQMSCLKRRQLEADKIAGRIIDILTFRKLRAKTYITISNSMIDVLGEINPNGNVFDLQHGIIYNGHIGYFRQIEELRPTFLIGNRRVLLWGELYKQNLKKLPEEIDPNDKFIVVGYPMYKRINLNEETKDKTILVSLQFTSDISPEISTGIMEMLDEFIEEATQQDYRILLKHHPRFAGEVNLNPLIEKYSGKLQLTNKPLAELADKIKLQVTWGSTTALEYAAYGVPTCFLRDSRFDWATEIFYGQYCYPLYDGLTTKDVLKRIEDNTKYHNDCRVIKNWYESAYSPLNEVLLVRILKGEKNEQ